MKVRKMCLVLAVLMLASVFAAGCGQSASEPAVSPAAAEETPLSPEPTAQAEEKKERNAIEGLILQLSDPDERAVIRLRYFDRADWESTCGVLFGDRRDYVDRVDAYQNRTYKIHGRALLNLAAVLDELEPLPEPRQ